MRRFVTIFAVVANLALADAITKEIAAARLKGAAAVSVIPGFFDLAYVENRGAAWGIFQGRVGPLAAFAVAPVLSMLKKKGSGPLPWVLFLGFLPYFAVCPPFLFPFLAAFRANPSRFKRM